MCRTECGERESPSRSRRFAPRTARAAKRYARASARMGLGSIEAVRHLLARGTHEDLAAALTGRHRYPNSRSGYVVVTREYLEGDCRMRLRERLEGFADPFERRDWLARSKGIKGV